MNKKHKYLRRVRKTDGRKYGGRWRYFYPPVYKYKKKRYIRLTVSLFVWENVLANSEGVMFARAASEAHARKLILAKHPDAGLEILKAPRIITGTEGFVFGKLAN